MLAADPERNALLGELISSAYEKDRKIVVFSTLHEHLKALHRVCRDHHGISGRKMGFYVGVKNKAEAEHREREKVKPLLFTTYVMMGEGTNIPWLDTAIFAIPRSRVAQAGGRVRREYPDKGTPVFIDLLDTDSPVFAGYGSARMKWYASIGAKVIDMV
jgi:superfamily II DNA or RNA helicase